MSGVHPDVHSPRLSGKPSFSTVNPSRHLSQLDSLYRSSGSGTSDTPPQDNGQAAMPGQLLVLVYSILTLLAVGCVRTLRQWRWKRFRQFSHVPQAGKPSFLWGHWKVMDRLFRKGDPRRHREQVMIETYKEMGNPPVLFFDLRPMLRPMLMIFHWEVAEQITKSSPTWNNSCPKSPTMRPIQHLTGERSIIVSNGDEWRQQRRRLNPGFAPQHLMTLLPTILDKTAVFLRRLDGLCETGEEFRLDEICGALTFDIIGAVAMGLDLKAQVPGQHHEIVLAFQRLVGHYLNYKRRYLPFLDWTNERRRRRCGSELDRLVKGIIRESYDRVIHNDAKARDVLALSLEGTQELTPDLLQVTSDNLRSFLFAGHDTTSILLQWAIYELSRSPRQLRSLRAELEELFGSDTDPAATREKLLRQPDVLNQMPYTAAVIKETLRLYPPAGSVRMSPPGTDFRLRLPNGEYIATDGVVMAISPGQLQRDPSVYGETAHDFLPERWLGDASGIPAGAWRPFERGPRNCIGQELANIEAKIVLACVARRYSFVKVGLGELELDGTGSPIPDERGYFRTKSTLFNSTQIIAKPVDRTVMEVGFRQY
ncbi:putative sterigmatocystin biosynthesismonooxygenase [Colletotrichum tanaceti]|uniref:Putative sterigmatocystin biosynthesismonooxygenase n=1 Tax=Colletotrichum tanaceti TaxID=1306861 RepID=A0A4U6XL80_9PEZI|nr:putative sterigmatocystin biosynthesismonooxygenase [Colletotrichum tanaceti]TKW56372.1 putative sterigmatocystin biosynthesismonooxygenase [Colletotrichum tanaceti]